MKWRKVWSTRRKDKIQTGKCGMMKIEWRKEETGERERESERNTDKKTN
jgi:hypothetical protein